MKAKNKFIDKILPIFINANFGIEKFDDTTFDIIDRSIIGKAKIGSVKVLEDGNLSVKLGGESSKHKKFLELMKDTSFKANPKWNVATVGKQVKNLVTKYKAAKKTIYKEAYNQITSNLLVEVTRDEFESAIDNYLTKCIDENIKESRADLLTYVSDTLSLTEDECEAKYGEILDLCLDYDEDTYINTMDRIFKESEIKSDFRKYLNETMSAKDILTTVKEDRTLRTLRETESYKNSDEETKAKKLQRYILHTPYLMDKFSNTKEIEEICSQIASEDEDNF